MIKVRRNNKSFLLLGILAFIFVSLILSFSFLFSDGNLDERARADSEIGVDLNPSTGNISTSGLDIDLVVHTHGESISGIDVTILYSGNVGYSGFSQGDIPNCSVTDIEQGVGQVNLHCFIDPAQPAYNGSGDVFATVTFVSTADGNAEIEITEVVFSVRDGRDEIIFLGGIGNYSTFMTLDSPSCGSLDNQAFPYETESWPSGTFCSGGTPDPLQPSFPAAGSYTSWRCLGEAEASVSCSAERDSVPPPRCGGLNAQIFKYEIQSWPSGNFCAEGSPNPTNPSFPLPGNTTEWECIGVDDSVPCSAEKELLPQDPLPEASISAFVGIFGGFALVIISAIIFIYKDRDSRESFSMRSKLCL